MKDNEQRDIFARNLNRLLQERDLTQLEVAKAIGVSAQTFNTWCRGIAIPRMNKIQKLADYFHVNKSILIDDEPSASAPAVQLSPAEDHLISVYRDLTPEGQAMVSDYADLVHDNDKYKNSIDREVYSAAG